MHIEQKLEDYEKESRRHQDYIKVSIDKISDEVKSLRTMLERQQTIIENQQKMLEKQQIMIEELTKKNADIQLQIVPIADIKKTQWFLISTVIAAVIVSAIGFFFTK